MKEEKEKKRKKEKEMLCMYGVCTIGRYAAIVIKLMVDKYN